MTQVRIAQFRGSAVPLPPVCICCGAPAQSIRSRRFSFLSGWSVLLLFAPGNLLWILLYYLFLCPRVRAATPTCARHRFHWFVRKLALAGGAAASTAALIACVEAEQFGRIWMISALSPAAIGWLVARRTGVQVVSIDDQSLILSGVSPEFVRALRETPLCLNCGYDLKGNVSGKCPECGHAERWKPDASATAAAARMRNWRSGRH